MWCRSGPMPRIRFGDALEFGRGIADIAGEPGIDARPVGRRRALKRAAETNRTRGGAIRRRVAPLRVISISSPAATRLRTAEKLRAASVAAAGSPAAGRGRLRPDPVRDCRSACARSGRSVAETKWTQAGRACAGRNDRCYSCRKRAPSLHLRPRRVRRDRHARGRGRAAPRSALSPQPAVPGHGRRSRLTAPRSPLRCAQFRIRFAEGNRGRRSARGQRGRSTWRRTGRTDHRTGRGTARGAPAVARWCSAGRAFSARTCATTCSSRATGSSASTTSTPARCRTSSTSGATRFAFVNHDLTEHIDVAGPRRLRLPPGQPGEPDRLPAAAAAHAQGRLLRHAQRARPREVQSGRASCSPRPARSTATRSSIRSPRATGATSTRSARAASTTRPSATPRR